MFLALLLMAAVSGSEGRYKGLACYKCDYIMSFCTFRCRHQPSVAHSYYCNDFCDRRNERCYLECVEDRYGHASWGPPLTVEWRHNTWSWTEHDISVLCVIHVIKGPHVESLCLRHYYPVPPCIHVKWPKLYWYHLNDPSNKHESLWVFLIFSCLSYCIFKCTLRLTVKLFLVKKNIY